MAVRLRLRRIGKKKQPQYRLVAAEASGPRDGRFIEVLGHYNPLVDPPAVSVNEERALWWLQHGAQPTDTARSLLVKAAVWEKFTGEPAPAPTAKAEPVEASEEAVSTTEEESSADVSAVVLTDKDSVDEEAKASSDQPAAEA